MNLFISKELKAELVQVDCGFKSVLLPWWPDLTEYINGLESEPTWCQLAAVVLSIYKYFGVDSERAASLTTVLKAVYFVKHIHGLVKDESEGQLHNQKLQFSILIGDYTFGHSLKMLLDCNSAALLDSFSAMVCEMNEGMVLQHKTDLNYIERIQKTIVPLYVYAFLTGARLAECSAGERELSRELGVNLGTAVELYIHNEKEEDIEPYVENSIKLFHRLNRSKSIPGSMLEKMIAELEQNCSEPKQAAGWFERRKAGS